MGLRPTQEDEISGRIDLWSPTLRTKQRRAKDGAPSICGGFGSILQTDSGAPSLRSKGGRPQTVAQAGQKQIPFGNDRKKGKVRPGGQKCSLGFATPKLSHATYLCHLDRSEAQWRDLRFPTSGAKSAPDMGHPQFVAVLDPYFKQILVPHPCVARVGDHKWWHKQDRSRFPSGMTERKAKSDLEGRNVAWDLQRLN